MQGAKILVHGGVKATVMAEKLGVPVKVLMEGE